MNGGPTTIKDCAYWSSLDLVNDLPAAIGDCFCRVWDGRLFKEIVADAIRGETGETALHLWFSAKPCAVMGGATSLAALLDDLTHQDGGVFGDPTDVLEAILALPGLDVNAVDINGWTALHAMTDDVDARAAKRLLDAGVDPATRDVAGRTALNLLRERGYDNADAEPMEAIACLEAAELRATANAVAPSVESRTRRRL